MSSDNVWHLITKTITTLEHFATLHHTSPIYTSLHLSTLQTIIDTLTTLIDTSLHLPTLQYYILWVCVGSLRYPACNAHAPYCHVWPAPLYSIFPRYHINGTIFKKKKIIAHRICVLIFYKTFVWNISHSKIENVYRSSCKVPLYFVRI